MTNEFYFTSYNGTARVYAKEWLPPEEPCAILLIAHGMTEHIGRYDRFAEFLAGYGILVAGADHCGHGKTAPSEEDYGYLPEGTTWETMMENIHLLRLLEQNAHPNLPIFLLGFSMGSFLIRNYLASHSDGISGVILVGTGEASQAALRSGLAMVALEAKKHGWHYRSTWVESLSVGRYNRPFMPVRTKHDWWTRDAARLDIMEADPACGYIFTLSGFKALFECMLAMPSRRELQKVSPKLPIFLISGASDPVGDNGRGVLKAAHTFQDSGLRNVTVKLYADCRHALLDELNYNQVYSDILTWLENQL